MIETSFLLVNWSFTFLKPPVLAFFLIPMPSLFLKFFLALLIVLAIFKFSLPPFFWAIPLWFSFVFLRASLLYFVQLQFILFLAFIVQLLDYHSTAAFWFLYLSPVRLSLKALFSMRDQLIFRFDLFLKCFDWLLENWKI